MGKGTGRVQMICKYRECTNTHLKDPALSFFYCTNKDQAQRDAWLTRSGNEDLVGSTAEHLKAKGFRLCAIHFENSEFVNIRKNRLVKNALPKLYAAENDHDVIDIAKDTDTVAESSQDDSPVAMSEAEFVGDGMDAAGPSSPSVSSHQTTPFVIHKRRGSILGELGYSLGERTPRKKTLLCKYKKAVKRVHQLLKQTSLQKDKIKAKELLMADFVSINHEWLECSIHGDILLTPLLQLFCRVMLHSYCKRRNRMISGAAIKATTIKTRMKIVRHN